MYLFGEPNKRNIHLFEETKIVVTGPDDILIGFHEKQTYPE